MLLALAVGIALQAAVTEIGPLIRLFGTVRLSLMEWGQLIFGTVRLRMEEWLRLLALSVTPLFVHELLVLVGMAGISVRHPSCRHAESREQEA